MKGDAERQAILASHFGHVRPASTFRLRGVARQYRHPRRVFAGGVRFFQVGRFMEFLQPDGGGVTAELGLQPLGRNRRGARLGFPLSHAGSHLRTLLAAGRAVALIGETGRRLDRVGKRVPRWKIVPVAARTDDPSRGIALGV